MDYLKETVIAIELHDVERMRICFENGINPNDIYKGRPLIEELISEYTRTPRFKDCVRAFVDFGLVFDNEALLAVLLDDETRLKNIITKTPETVDMRCSFKNAYTQCIDISLLHVCSEFNHLNCAKVLIGCGADVNAKAGFDKFGFGGQTPVFHTVNQNNNHSAPILNYLLLNNSDITITVPGLIWGNGYEWETLIPSVNPISYAMMGLLPQMHRNEKDIAETVSKLLKSAYNIDYTNPNIPNAYLVKK